MKTLSASSPLWARISAAWKIEKMPAGQYGLPVFVCMGSREIVVLKYVIT